MLSFLHLYNMTVFYYTPQREVWTLQMSYRDIYKITEIVWALWLDKRSVWMRVCKHGRNVKMFCFLHVNHTSTNLKTFLSWKPDKFILFTHSLISWNLKEKSIFWKASYLQNKSWLCLQDFTTVKNFSFNQCHNKELHFFSRKLIYKSNRNLFFLYLHSLI